MGLFSDIGNQKRGKSGIYFLPGRYPILEVNRLKVDTTRPPKSEEFFAAEFKIHASEVAERPAGSEITFMRMAKHDSSQGEIADLFRSLIVCRDLLEGNELRDPQEPSLFPELTEAKAKEYVGETQPLAGVFIAASAVNKDTQSGGTFTIVDWEPPDLDLMRELGLLA